MQLTRAIFIELHGMRFKNITELTNAVRDEYITNNPTEFPSYQETEGCVLVAEENKLIEIIRNPKNLVVQVI